MDNEEYVVVTHPIYGYRRLEPIPEEDKLTRFYQSQYYDLIRAGGRAPELRRLMAGGEEAEHERRWLRATLYSDVCFLLNEYARGNRVLDIGCGTGELLSFLQESGFDPVGIEPAAEAAEVARSLGQTVHDSTLEEFLKSHDQDVSQSFDAAILLNVLEHVPDPAATIELLKEVLKPQGLLCVRVPNDFSKLQLTAKELLNKHAWWVAIPDHINYFDFQSLRTFLERLGLEVIYAQSDFPMELFLLMGDDYVGNSELGSKCHQKRVSFELAITKELRRSIYQALAKAGTGRNCLVFAKLIDK